MTENWLLFAALTCVTTVRLTQIILTARRQRRLDTAKLDTAKAAQARKETSS